MKRRDVKTNETLDRLCRNRSETIRCAEDLIHNLSEMKREEREAALVLVEGYKQEVAKLNEWIDDEFKRIRANEIDWYSLRMEECPACHSDVSSTAKFCSSCGHQMSVSTQTCSCGYIGLSTDEYCAGCGRELSKSRVDNLKEKK